MVKVVLVVSGTVVNSPSVPMPVPGVAIMLVGEVVQELLSVDHQVIFAESPELTIDGVA
jgi:hypothetical protein